MTAEWTPITEADVCAVAEFLRVNHNHRVPWARACSGLPWGLPAPNYGFALRDEGHIVGAILALYSERMIAGRLERFCNLGSWCVLPAYRSRSLSLLNAALAQDGYHFTILSPDTGPQEILSWLKFQFLDTTAAFIPNLPWPSMGRGARVVSDPSVVERTLTGGELEIYHDHVLALAARHLVIIDGDDHCYVMYREFRRNGLPVFAMILHVSNPDIFTRHTASLTRHLLLRRGLIATLAELRLVERRPRLSLLLNSWPKMFRSASLQPANIDYLYSELACVPW